jgi:hypothetical protein
MVNFCATFAPLWPSNNPNATASGASEEMLKMQVDPAIGMETKTNDTMSTTIVSVFAAILPIGRVIEPQIAPVVFRAGHFAPSGAPKCAAKPPITGYPEKVLKTKENGYAKFGTCQCSGEFTSPWRCKAAATAC